VLGRSVPLPQKRRCTGAIDSFTAEEIAYWDNRFLYYRSGCVLGQSIPLLQKRLCTWTIDSFTTEETVYLDDRFLYYRRDCVLGLSVPLLQKRLCIGAVHSFTTEAIVDEDGNESMILLVRNLHTLSLYAFRVLFFLPNRIRFSIRCRVRFF
jgi:hypothetical protein